MHRLEHQLPIDFHPPARLGRGHQAPHCPWGDALCSQCSAAFHRRYRWR
jgi:hypothetical protein